MARNSARTKNLQVDGLYHLVDLSAGHGTISDIIGVYSFELASQAL
jgi:hypothetical protein